MHFRFFRLLLAPEDGGAAAPAATPAAPAESAPAAPAPAATPAAPAESLLGGASATPPAEGAKPEGEAKPGEPGSPDGKKDPEAPEGAPEQYTDFTLPEGVEANEVALGEFKAVAKELNLSQAGAQRLVDLHAKQITELAQAPYKVWADTQAKWVQEIQADPEIGGAKLPENLAAAARAIDALGGQALRQALTFTGAGNNPVVIKAFVQMGKALAEDSILIGNPPPSVKSTAEKFYPTTTKET